MEIAGGSRPIHDAAAKARGDALYAADKRLPGMLYAALVTSEIPHGRVVEIDPSRAFEVPGVAEVFHCLNTDAKPYSRYRTLKDQQVKEQERVFQAHVRHVGDVIGCVLAETESAARAAAKKVRVRYERYPHSLTAEDSLAGAIDDVHPDGAVYGDIVVEAGEKPAADGGVTVRTETTLARLAHMALEPHACVAEPDPDTGGLTLYSPNQSVYGIRTVIAEMLELSYNRVRVVKTTMGGSFGGKQEWIAEPVAAVAAYKAGRPVSLSLTREEVFTSTISRSPMEMRVESLLDRDGTLQSLTVDNTLDAGAYLGNSYDYCGAVANKFFRCYRYRYMKYTGRAVITNTPVSGAYRGWTSPEFAAALEHNLNVAAKRLDMDPVELRLQNAARPGDMDLRLEISLGEIRLRECLERGRERFGWAEKRKEDAEFNATSARFRRGTAVACGGHLSGYYPRVNDFCEVGMRMWEDGSVTANVTLHDHGCGAVAAFRMLIARTLGIPEEMVSVGEGDTGSTPFDYGCFSSRTIYVIGRCACDCAEKLLENLKAEAAELCGKNPRDLRAADGFVTSRGEPEFRVAYGEVAQQTVSRLQRAVTAVHKHVNRSNPGVTGAHFAHVEVDTLSGLVKVLDYTAVHDIGRAINRGMCEAQIQGAVLMGIGAATSEKYGMDSDGRPTRSMQKYHVVNACDAPEIQVEFIQDGGGDGPFGAKSIGEVCYVPAAPAVAGAINDALDAELCDLPLDPDAIVRAVKGMGRPL